MNLPNLEELSFLAVLAFPKASNNGLESNIYSSMHNSFFIFLFFYTLARYFKIIFVDSVFPDPDSPEITIA